MSTTHRKFQELAPFSTVFGSTELEFEFSPFSLAANNVRVSLLPEFCSFACNVLVSVEVSEFCSVFVEWSEWLLLLWCPIGSLFCSSSSSDSSSGATKTTYNKHYKMLCLISKLWSWPVSTQSQTARWVHPDRHKNIAFGLWNFLIFTC